VVSAERGARLITGLRTTLEPAQLGRRDDDARPSLAGQTKSGIG